MFFDITCLDPTISKLTVLNQYSGTECWWIEDHPVNYQIGVNAGLKSLLVNQTYNQLVSAGDNRVNNWFEIYERIVG
jgi:uncharacterized HAD superfamily protein